MKEGFYLPQLGWRTRHLPSPPLPTRVVDGYSLRLRSQDPLGLTEKPRRLSVTTPPTQLPQAPTWTSDLK